MNAIVWRDEIYERAPDFKSRVANARFRSVEWRFLAALDGRRSAGEIADALKLDPEVIGKFIASLDAAGTIVPALLSIEEFERVAGLLLAGEEIERDFPEAGIAALRESYDAAASDLPPREPARPAAAAVVPPPSPEKPPEREALAAVDAPRPSAPTVDASVGAAFETLRKMRQRSRSAATEAATPPSDADAAPGASPENVPVEPAASTSANGASQASAAHASLVESLALAPKPDEERAIVHQSATMIPLASMLEQVKPDASGSAPPPAEPYDPEADAAAWNAILERTRNGGTNGASGGG